MSEKGPVYGVELIDTLPMNYGQTKGMTQAMPSRADLIATQQKVNTGGRVAAGYEILLNHWREQGEEIERLQTDRDAWRAATGLAGGTASEAGDRIDALDEEVERLRTENKQLSEVDGLPTAGAQYVHALNTIVDLRTVVKDVRLYANCFPIDLKSPEEIQADLLSITEAAREDSDG